MKLFVLILLLLTTCLAWGQADTVFIRYDKNQFGGETIEYKTDTILFETPAARSILHGTTVLPWTANQQLAKGYGLYLDKVRIASCRQGEKPKELEEVVSVATTGKTLIIQLNILGNCCHSFLCDVQIVNDSIVNLLHYGYGATYCSCFCCFGLTYEFSLERDSTDLDRLKKVMINGDERTLKYLK